MSEARSLIDVPPKLVIAPEAIRDIRSILRWSERNFGQKAAERYRSLLIQALRDIADDPERPGSRASPEIMIRDARTYHLESSRTKVQGGRVNAPRHQIIYRRKGIGKIEIGRILHDEQDIARHIPADYLPRQ